MKISYMLVNNSGHGLSMPTGAAWHWIHEVDDEKQMRSILERLTRISGSARSLFERALEMIAQHEGIELQDVAS